MINSLSVSNVGNFATKSQESPTSITFDNGINLVSSKPCLGKSLTLDMCWMLLTGTNPTECIVPIVNSKKSIISNDFNHLEWSMKRQSFFTGKKSLLKI